MSSSQQSFYMLKLSLIYLSNTAKCQLNSNYALFHYFLLNFFTSGFCLTSQPFQRSPQISPCLKSLVKDLYDY